MEAMTDDQYLHSKQERPVPPSRLDMATATRMSLGVLISAPRDCALRLALEIAMGPGEESADGVVIVQAADTTYLQSALRRATTAGCNRRRAVVVQDVDALDQGQQSTLRLTMEDIARNGANACRIIATTSVPLFERVAEGLFDAGLFYRLNTIHIRRGA
jgi:hypothetical protein